MTARLEQGLDRIRLKLEQCFQEGDLYHAHQMYRTIYFRTSGQQKFTECAELMFEGAERLLSNGDRNSGSDLATLYVEVMTKGALTATNDVLKRLAKLHSMMKARSPERLAFTADCMRYSSTFGQTASSVQNDGNSLSGATVGGPSKNCKSVDSKNSFGHPDLHRLFALNLWREKNFSDARYHFVHSTDGTNCARMLIEFHISCGYKSEVDLFIAQTVFQFLCLKNQRTATVAFFVYIRRHPAVEGPPFAFPLLNFLWFLLLAVENGAKLALFTYLCDKYRTSLDRDPTYRLYLEKIGEIFFGKQPTRKDQEFFGGSGSFFGNMLNQLMTGFSEEADDTDDIGVSTEEVD